MPTPHGEQAASDPVALYVPAGHGTPEDDSAATGQYKPGPGEHTPEHVSDMATSVYRPTGHGAHFVAPAPLYRPGGQAPGQTLMTTNVTPNKPALQGKHVEEPVAVEYVPKAQAAPAGDTDPATHAEPDTAEQPRAQDEEPVALCDVPGGHSEQLDGGSLADRY